MLEAPSSASEGELSRTRVVALEAASSVSALLGDIVISCLALDFIDHLIDISLIDFEIETVILCLISEFGQEALWQTTIGFFLFHGNDLLGKSLDDCLTHSLCSACESAVDASIVIAEMMPTSPRVYGPLALPDRHQWRQKSLLFAPSVIGIFQFVIKLDLL